MHPVWRDWATVAVIVPVVSLAAVWMARKVAHWLVAAMEHSFAQVVLEVMAPDMAHLGTKVTTSMDELRLTNTDQHTEVGQRLAAVELRQTDVEARLAAVESKLNIRAPEARTRKEDTT